MCPDINLQALDICLKSPDSAFNVLISVCLVKKRVEMGRETSAIVHHTLLNEQQIPQRAGGTFPLSSETQRLHLRDTTYKNM